VQRIGVRMDRYPDGELITEQLFRAKSEPNDLAYTRSSSLAYIAASSDDAGKRLVLFRGPDTEPDQAVETVIDRVSPARTGHYEELGLLLAWLVGRTQSSQVSCAGGTSAPAEFFGEISEDEALGLTNHIGVSVGTELKITEIRDDADGTPQTSTLWSMPLTAAHRRIALRAAIVEGEVVLWWNPLGRLEFEERPLARVHTLLDGPSKCGVFCGRDGRFLELSFEYRVGTVSQPVIIQSAEALDLDLRPVLIEAKVDMTRPPMLTMMQVAHADDTRLPERQERTSRIDLRGGRFLLRPGHSYVATAVYLNVDDDTVTGTSRPFSIDGEEEDLALRDCLGRRIAPGETGDDLSDVDVLVWPAELKIAKTLETSAAPGRADSQESMDVTLRGTQRSSLAPRSFSYPVQLDEDGRKRILSFLAESQGRVIPFVWTHPITGERVVCNFGESRLTIRPVENDQYTAQVTVIENPRCIGRAQGPPSVGYSLLPVGEPPTGTPTGACCLPDGSCVEVSEAQCAGVGGAYHGDDTVCAGATPVDPTGTGSIDSVGVECPDPEPPFDCDADCGSDPSQCQAGISLIFCPSTLGCPPTHGVGAAALCGCFQRSIASCTNACSGNVCAGGVGIGLVEDYCCYEGVGAILVGKNYTGDDPVAYCISQGMACILFCDGRRECL
jgi:hypothetical protein